MFSISPYYSQTELVRAHPEVKSFAVVHHIQSGETVEDIHVALRKKHIEGAIYQVGGLLLQRADTLPSVHYANAQPETR
jgi:hypothetical protein